MIIIFRERVSAAQVFKLPVGIISAAQVFQMLIGKRFRTLKIGFALQKLDFLYPVIWFRLGEMSNRKCSCYVDHRGCLPAVFDLTSFSNVHACLSIVWFLFGFGLFTIYHPGNVFTTRKSENAQSFSQMRIYHFSEFLIWFSGLSCFSELDSTTQSDSARWFWAEILVEFSLERQFSFEYFVTNFSYVGEHGRSENNFKQKQNALQIVRDSYK